MDKYLKMDSKSSNFKGMDTEISKYIGKIYPSYQKEKPNRSVTYKEFLKNRMLIIRCIRNGIPFQLFSVIRENSPFNDHEWAMYLDISTKSLQRYRSEKEHLFKPSHSEKIIELSEVLNLGSEVFDSNEQFYLWLNTPSQAMGNNKPKDLLKDSYGKEVVMNELIRIDEGIFS